MSFAPMIRLTCRDATTLGLPVTVLLIGGRIIPADIPALCRLAQVLVEKSHNGVILCDVRALNHPDAVAVDALARLQLAAKRLGGNVALVHVTTELQELLDLCGLSDVLRSCDDLGVEPSGQTEQREEPGGVQKERDPPNPSAG